MKKTLAFIMMLAVLFSLAACGTEDGGSAASPTPDSPTTTTNAPADEGLPVTGAKSSHLDSGTDPLQIAFIIYSWSDDQGIYIQECAEHLEENFNVKFEYISANNTAEETISAVESLCSKGVDGIITANTKGFQSWASICEENGVWYSIMLGCLEDADDQEFAATCKYFLGSLGNLDYSFLGEAYAEFTIDQGYESILVAAPSRGMQTQADQMVAAYEAALDAAGISYSETRSSFGELFTSVAAELAANTYDVIYCPLSMMNFAVSNVYANDLVGTTQVMGHGLSEDLEDARSAGVVSMFSDNFTSGIGVNFALVANAIEGNHYADWPQDTYVNITSPCFIIRDEAEYELYSAKVRNYDESPILCNADMVKQLIASYNADASYAAVKDYVEGISLDTLQ